MADGKNKQERRRHARAKRVLKVEYRLYRHKGVVVDGIWQNSVTEDMSLAGVLFKSQIPYVVGDIIQVRVVMSGILDVFRGFGRVVRTEKEKASGVFLIGVTYVDEKTPGVKSS